MASFMLNALLVGGLLAVAAVLAERVSAPLPWPRRGIWIATMIASIALPAYTLLPVSQDGAGERTAAELTPSATQTMQQRSNPGNLARGESIIQTLYVPRLAFPVERALNWPLTILWLGTAIGVALLYLLASWRLSCAARQWTSKSVENVDVLVSNEIGPAIFGFAKPRIVVPSWLLDAPLATRTMVLRHEREHVLARDQLLLLTGLLACALAPWNPALWWQLRRLRLAIEIDCDARVVQGGADGVEYSRALLAVSERRLTTPLAAIALTEPASQLERRIGLVLESAPRMNKLLAMFSLSVAVAAVVAACALDVPEPRGEGNRDVSIESPYLHRQPVTGLLLGGERIAILVDVSASMLDRVPVDAGRRRAMSAAEQRGTPKWRQLADVVDWLAMQIPSESQFQVIAFNDEARSLVAGTNGKWIAARDVRSIELAVRTLREETLPRGERNLEAALAAASELTPPADNVYLLVDGLPTTSDSVRGSGLDNDPAAHWEAAMQRRPPGAPINVILLPMERGDSLAAPAYWNFALETSGSLLAPAENWP